MTTAVALAPARFSPITITFTRAPPAGCRFSAQTPITCCQGLPTRCHFGSEVLVAQLVALGGDCLTLEDGPEVTDPESQEEEHGDSISAGLSQHCRELRIRGDGLVYGHAQAWASV
jgi:hypothetical protein